MHAFDQCYFSIHLSVTWTGNHRNASVIFSYNPRISPAPHAQTGVTRSYLIYALLIHYIVVLWFRFSENNYVNHPENIGANPGWPQGPYKGVKKTGHFRYMYPVDEITFKKCVDNLSEHNQFCSAILSF